MVSGLVMTGSSECGVARNERVESYEVVRCKRAAESVPVLR